MHILRAASFLLALAVVLAGNTTKPHIVYFLLDDLGWADVGWHSPSSDEVMTPNLNALVADGVELDRHYGASCVASN